MVDLEDTSLDRLVSSFSLWDHFGLASTMVSLLFQMIQLPQIPSLTPFSTCLGFRGQPLLQFFYISTVTALGGLTAYVSGTVCD